MKELLEEAADWIANDRDEIILSHSVGGDTATLDDEARELVSAADELIGRLLAAAREAE